MQTYRPAPCHKGCSCQGHVSSLPFGARLGASIFPVSEASDSTGRRSSPTGQVAVQDPNLPRNPTRPWYVASRVVRGKKGWNAIDMQTACTPDPRRSIAARWSVAIGMCVLLVCTISRIRAGCASARGSVDTAIPCQGNVSKRPTALFGRLLPPVLNIHFSWLFHPADHDRVRDGLPRAYSRSGFEHR